MNKDRRLADRILDVADEQLAVDLVILNERATSYVQDLQVLLETLLRTSLSAGPHDGHAPHGNVYIVQGDRVTAPQRDVLQSVARPVLSSRRGTLAEQVVRAPRPDAAPAARASAAGGSAHAAGRGVWPPDLELFNGLGGFAADGRDDVTVLGEGRWAPAPWINVIANAGFGLPGLRIGFGLHVVGQWPREPAHRLVE